MSSVGKAIQECRRRKGIKQEELAALSGISSAFVSAIERGIKEPSLRSFVMIVNALNVSPNELLADSSEVTFDIQSTEINQVLETLRPQDRATILKVVRVMADDAQNRYDEEEE